MVLHGGGVWREGVGSVVQTVIGDGWCAWKLWIGVDVGWDSGGGKGYWMMRDDGDDLFWLPAVTSATRKCSRESDTFAGWKSPSTQYPPPK